MRRISLSMVSTLLPWSPRRVNICSYHHTNICIPVTIALPLNSVTCPRSAQHHSRAKQIRSPLDRDLAKENFLIMRTTRRRRRARFAIVRIFLTGRVFE